MAANSIGSVTFNIFQGEIQVPVVGVQVIPRVGRDYARTRNIGIQSRPSTIITSDPHTSAANAVTAMETTYPALIGTVVTVVNSLNESFENCNVLNVVLLRYKKIEGAGSDTHWVQAQWTILAGEQS